MGEAGECSIMILFYFQAAKLLSLGFETSFALSDGDGVGGW